MKNKLRFLCILASLLGAFPVFSAGYKIKIKAHGVVDSMVYLGYYFGDKQYLKDSLKAGPKGDFVFEGDTELPRGIYLIVLPGRKYFEIIVDEDQDFYWEADYHNLEDFNAMKTSGSEENTRFLAYSKFIGERSKVATYYRDKVQIAKNAGDSGLMKIWMDSSAAVDKSVEDYKEEIIQKHPNAFMTMVFKSMKEPVVPEPPILSNGRPDSTFKYRYYKDHYWDYINFSDDRIVRTPVFHNKLKTFITQLTLQIPDSINSSADFVVEKARASKELFKYCVWFITYHYETSKIMGMDAVFVHMVDKYYAQKEAFWVDDVTLFKMTDRARAARPLLIGKTAPDLFMKDHLGNYKSLHQTEAPYTILVFWDPDCGHCKKQVPVIDSVYKAYKGKGVKVFAACTEREFDKWLKFIKDNNLEWIHVADSTLFFKRVYDITTTPIIYLLDKEKKIVAKRLAAEQLGEILQRRFKDEEDPVFHD